MVTWLDGILLGAAQKFCDKTQWLIGLTKFTLEKWTAILMAIFHLACFSLDPRPVLTAVILIFAVAVAFLVRDIERAEVEFLKNGKLMQPFFNMPVRITIVIVMGSMAVINSISADLAGNMLSYGEVGYILWAYFGACVPRPPSKSKAREWYEKTLTAFNDSLKPAPVPTN